MPECMSDRAARASTPSGLRLPGQFKPDRRVEDGPFAAYVATVRRAIPAMRKIDLEPTAEDLQLVSTLAYETDDLADALAAAILVDPTLAAQLDRGLADGIASLDEPPQVLVDYLDYYENIPDWADYEKLAGAHVGPEASGGDGAQLAAARSPIARVLLEAIALGSGFYIGANYPAVGQSLRATGTITNGNARVLQTARWAQDTFATPGALARFGIGIQSSAKVRLAHAFARRQIEAWGEWDEDYYGTPISSFDNMVFLSGLLMLPDVAVALGTPADSPSVELSRLQTRSVQYLLGAPRRLVEMPTDRIRRFFVLVVGHLDESPETARPVVESIRTGYRPAVGLRQRLSRAMTLLVANMFVRRAWGNGMADRIGLERFWWGLPVPWLSHVFFQWGPRAAKPGLRLARVLSRLGLRSRRPVLPPEERRNYEGTAGVFSDGPPTS